MLRYLSALVNLCENHLILHTVFTTKTIKNVGGIFWYVQRQNYRENNVTKYGP